MAQKPTEKSTFLRLWIGLGILLLILLAFLMYYAWPSLTGKTIVLATQPVDPFDPLRGQYMTIRYDIGSIPDAGTLQVGDTVYVILAENSSGIWTLQGTSSFAPTAGDFIKGMVVNDWGDQLQVEYGIEQF